MGYKGSFLDGVAYTNSDLHNRLRKYVTSGIADPFTNGVPYNATKLNDITVPISTSGVVLENITTCKCSINTVAKTVSIAAGPCFFDNGTDIEIDVDGVTLPYTVGVINYIFVKSDLSTNTIAPYCTTTQPTGDYVLLGEISAGEVLTDKRVYAKGKLPGYQSNANSMYKDTISMTFSWAGTTKTLYLSSAYTMLFFQHTPLTGGSGFGNYDIATGAYASVAAEDNAVTTNRIDIKHYGYYGYYLTIVNKGNGEFELTAKCWGTSNPYGYSFYVWGL